MNPFQTMRARYFLIVFALLILIARSSNELLESTFHIQNSSFINMLIFYILPIIWIFYGYRKHRVSFSLFINRNETFNLVQVLYIAIMLCMFSYGYLILYMYSFAWITPDFIMNALHEPIIDSTGGYVFQFIMVVFIAPIVGEFVFRGFLLQRFAAKWGTSIAMVVVALLFGCLHVDFLGAVVFSIVLSIVYIRTKSLLMPIAIHMLNNALVLSSSFLVSREKIMSFADFSNYTTFFPGLIIFMTGLNLVLIFLFVNRKYWSKEVPVIYAEKEKSFSSIAGDK
ncbi:CPBP family intramembrane metalloprotease [Bacillus sp. TH22]|uniref:CPBP family intramembrane glutamic endopeptidase n=1 Tax=unclassified Bacillus (in: firmicutes) TaxID=185979 RepID=UPI0019145EEC|nr:MULTISPECIES: type II CAAX endopeptidase family protein [unclassified Bacillus (in: firmicutes)]MBK5361159.1 CPBP family intramembrane metalloprotease [Bacillus sp. TH44]MBK5347143.1 CPBP family intramembrane metalloprotease [Bacillus sp. TH45]MBK5365952.1 CPBP family intramembrane metalloprotease [Bacillus sp. TH50]MBK5448943.1 CPBP family intramembrane metalloprotease [Bacillus sp. TH22]MBK5457120.1 CPBP family intramembrane metalloprotease [Bacillus sp. TH23]